MPATFLSTTAVEVFPAALRNEQTGKYTTEDNLTKAFKAATGLDSYVVKNEDNFLEFVIDGHYFKVNTSGVQLSDNLYAYILEESTTKTLRNVDESIGASGSTDLDVGGNFKGLAFDSTAPGTGFKYLQIKSGGSIINLVPKLSAITIGAGLLNSGTVITSSGTIAMPTTGITAGTYQGITFDAFGRATAAIDKKYGTGTVTSITAGTGLTGGTITSSGIIALATTGITPNVKYQGITFDAFGRAISATNEGYTINTGTVTKITAGTGLTTTVDGTGGNITAEGTLYLTNVYGSSTHLGTTATADNFGDAPANYKPVDFYVGTDGRITSGKTLSYPFKDIVNPIIGSYLSEYGAGTATTANSLKINYNSTTSYRPILLAPYQINQTQSSANVYTYNTVSVNTQSGYIKATKFIGADSNVKAFTGNLSGNADTATTATTATKLGTTTVGGVSQPIYLNAGVATATTENIGTGSQPIYLNAGKITALTTTKGTTSQPIYLNAGKITAITATVGQRNTTNKVIQGIYLDNGVATSGQAVYWSTATPGTTSGRIGDIWIQY